MRPQRLADARGGLAEFVRLLRRLPGSQAEAIQFFARDPHLSAKPLGVGIQSQLQNEITRHNIGL